MEDRPTADFLHEVGVDLLQGYFLGRPLPADEWSNALLGAAAVRAALIPRQPTVPSAVLD